MDTRKRVTLRMPNDLYDKLLLYAEKNFMNLNTACLLSIAEKISNTNSKGLMANTNENNIEETNEQPQKVVKDVRDRVPGKAIEEYLAKQPKKPQPRLTKEEKYIKYLEGIRDCQEPIPVNWLLFTNEGSNRPTPCDTLIPAPKFPDPERKNCGFLCNADQETTRMALTKIIANDKSRVYDTTRDILDWKYRMPGLMLWYPEPLAEKFARWLATYSVYGIDNLAFFNPNNLRAIIEKEKQGNEILANEE